MPYVDYDEVAASCPECGRNFRSEEDLERHLAEVHAGPAAQASTPAPGGAKRAGRPASPDR